MLGWNTDDVTDAEFWFVVEVIRATGRLEEWTPPVGFHDSGNRRPMRRVVDAGYRPIEMQPNGRDHDPQLRLR